MKKVLLTATVQSHICQFHKPLVEILHEEGYEVHVAAKDNLLEKNGLKLDFVDKVYDIPFARSPKSADNIKAYKELKKIINEEQYEIIHCNTPMGGIITRLAAMKPRRKGTKVYYTAHGFHFYKGAPKLSWLIYYPIEKIFSYMTDKIITINHEDYELSKRKFNGKTYYIHGVGVYASRYNTEPIAEDVRKEFGLSDDDFVILCTGELNENKNQKTLISAASKTDNKNIKVLLAGNGNNRENLENQIKELGLCDRVKLIGYRTDLEKIVKISDLIVSMSKREGLAMNLIEGMLCKKPVIAAVNRGHKELVDHKLGGYLIENSDVDMLAEKIVYLYNNSEVRRAMGEYNEKRVRDFCTENVKKELRAIYEF